MDKISAELIMCGLLRLAPIIITGHVIHVLYTDEFMKLQLLPNGHTYTFSIIGDVDSEDAPIKIVLVLNNMGTQDEKVYTEVVALPLMSC